MYTSLETSKKLKEWTKQAGVCLESDNWHSDRGKLDSRGLGKIIVRHNDMIDEYGHNRLFRAYDILNDICVKYSKEFFGNKEEQICFQNEEARHDLLEITKVERITFDIMILLQQGKQKEAEEYILANTILNPNNK